MIIQFFKLLLQDSSLTTVDLIIIFILVWIKFNDLEHIQKWQKEHKKHSEELGKTITQHGEDIEGLKQGKKDK